MTPHDRLPSLTLALLFLGRVVVGIADGRRVDEHVSPLERHQASRLGVPLIPADHHPQPTDAGVDGMEAEVARREVELLVVGRVVGDVHLPVDARYRPVAFEDDGRVVIETGSAPLEE